MADQNDTIFFILQVGILIDEGMERQFAFLSKLPIFELRELICYQKEIHALQE